MKTDGAVHSNAREFLINNGFIMKKKEESLNVKDLTRLFDIYELDQEEIKQLIVKLEDMFEVLDNNQD